MIGREVPPGSLDPPTDERKKRIEGIDLVRPKNLNWTGGEIAVPDFGRMKSLNPRYSPLTRILQLEISVVRVPAVPISSMEGLSVVESQEIKAFPDAAKGLESLEGRKMEDIAK